MPLMRRSKFCRNVASCDSSAKSARGSGERRGAREETSSQKRAVGEATGAATRSAQGGPLSVRKSRMAGPGRPLRCTGDPLENAHIIAAALHADGYKDASPPDEFPLRLTSGSHAREVLGLSNEFFFPLLAIPGSRK